MPELANLYVIYNYRLGGCVPAFTSVPKLAVFQGYYNRFTCVAPSYSLPALWRFDVKNQNYYGGGITGTIPDFSGSPNLKYLVLAQNKFTGSITGLEVHTQLTDVLVFENQLSGPLSTFTNSPNLKVIYASSNEFSGQVPDYNHLNLTQLMLYSNQFSGTPSNITGTNLNTLQYYLIGDNLYDFTSFENITNPNLATYLQDPAKSGFTYNTQATYDLIVSGTTADASNSGGTVSNITYNWYKIGPTGDPTLITSIHGSSTINLQDSAYNLQNGDEIFATAEHDEWTVPAVEGERLILYSNKHTITSILSVGFGKLTTFIKNGELLIDWNTISETNNAQFIIEISTNGIDGWKKIGEVKSKAENGNSTTGIDYSFKISLSSALGMLAMTLLFGLFIPGVNKRKRIVLSILAIAMTVGYFSCQKSDLIGETKAGEKIFVRLSQVDKDGTTKVLKIQEAVRK